MADEPLRRVERIVTTHDLTWLLDLHRNNQLNLEPTYQRKSVWTPRDRRFFMDTVFRNYPSPAIFLHKTIDDATGAPTYHVVDGKQRILTILMYVQNKFALASDFGDSKFDGKRWKDFEAEVGIKRLLWNYRITVEELDDASFPDINDVFSRLNKNSSKLNRQELRHARFDGWLITELEREAEHPLWKSFKVRTAAKERRMTDVQNLAELVLVSLRNDVSGFNQDDLDQLFADHDDPTAEESEFDADSLRDSVSQTRDALGQLEEMEQTVSNFAQPFLHLYTLWAYVARNGVSTPEATSERYRAFMTRVAQHEFDDTEEPGYEAGRDASLTYADLVDMYKRASVGATTDEPKRRDRLTALEAALSLSSSAEDEG